MVFQLLACFFLIVSLFYHYDLGFSQQTLPEQAFSAPSDHALFTAEILSATPSAQPTLTLPLMINDAATATQTADATASAEVSDFCQHVPVLLYHHIQPLPIADQLGHEPLTIESNIFDEQMRYLVEHGYHAVSAEDLVTSLLTRQPLPEKSVVITIDDGYDDAYTYGFMLAKKYQLVMSFMIPTSLIGTPGFMNWDHLKEMNENPYAKIYNHTATHAALGLISQQQIEEELSSSSAAFKANLGLNNTVFTYPYGSFSDEAISMVKQHGFSGAYSTIEGQEQCASQIMTLPRSHIGNAPLNEYGL